MTQHTRMKIVETAARLFHEQGYAATGVATILREAGVNSGSLYHCFDSKQALLVAVLEWYRAQLLEDILGPLEASHPDPIDRLFALLEWYREFLAQRQCRMGCPVGNLALEVSDSCPEVRPLIQANFDTWKDALSRWLSEASGRLPADSEPTELACFVLSVMEGGVMQSRAAGRLQPYDRSVATLRRLFDSPRTDALPSAAGMTVQAGTL